MHVSDCEKFITVKKLNAVLALSISGLIHQIAFSDATISKFRGWLEMHQCSLCIYVKVILVGGHILYINFYIYLKNSYFSEH